MHSIKKDKIVQFTFLKNRKQVDQKAKKSFLYMNPSTMKVLKFKKGSLILIHTELGQLLYRCWPYLSLESSVIMLPTMNFFKDYLSGSAYCECYSLSLHSCDIVVLDCGNSESFVETTSFKNFIKAHLDSVYIREGLKFNVSYLGYPHSFTIKKIYSNATDIIKHESSMIDICSDVCNLNISEEHSFSETFSPLCSTPIAKNPVSHISSHNWEIKLTEQFYCMSSETKILIEKPKVVHSYSNQIFFNHLGGLEKQINELKTLVFPLLNKNKYSIHKEHCCSIILVGASGTGKTAIVQAMSNEYHLPVLTLDGGIFSSYETGYKFHLRKFYNEIIDNSPCIFFLDNIDRLLETSNNMYSQKKLALSSMIYDLLDSRYNVLIISTAQNINSIDSSLRKPGTFEKEIYFGIPSANDRKKILHKIFEQKSHNLSIPQIDEISEMSHGFTGGDLKLLCDKADISSEDFITFEGLKETLKNVQPSSMVEFTFEVPNVKWSDIGGMHAVKTAITEMVEWPLKHAEQFKRFGIIPSRGILLYGPPGCSKTMIAKALVSEGHLNFISIKGPQLFNKYVGESEKAVSELFKKARSAAPCVLFFDEIDSLTSVRGSTSGNSNVSDRILTQLLVEIDGVDVLQGVSIIAATNRPDMIDPSFLRPGRFDQMIYVPLPDILTRKEIFEAKIKNMPHASDIDITYLAETTEGYTGAEITEICREAALSAIKEYLVSPSSVVKMLHFLTAIKSVAPRTSEEMLKFYENYSKKNIN